MNRKRFTYLAAILSLVTFVGHSIGVISNRAMHEVPAFATYELMKHTSVNFPMGFRRDIATLMTGSNLCLSVYLLVAGLLCLIFAGNTAWSVRDRQVIAINSGGLLLTGLISAFCFFPVPAAFLILASALNAAALRMKS